jgi:hypothetical protein
MWASFLQDFFRPKISHRRVFAGTVERPNRPPATAYKTSVRKQELPSAALILTGSILTGLECFAEGRVRLLSRLLPTFYIPHGGGPCFFMAWNPPDAWQKLAGWLAELGRSITPPLAFAGEHVK